jgi:predicted Co/Zn/Cd cation transporter (cation efflux family)
MIRTKKFSKIIALVNLWLMQGYNAWAQNTADPFQASDDFSKQMLLIIQGPLLKLLAGIVLLVGIAGLLRGRHRLAISCAMAFILILFLPILLQKV